MTTLPDGMPGRMQLYLFSALPGGIGQVRDVNGADDAAIVYHEYTHGLTDRLIGFDAGGLLASAAPQGDALSEGWSDWYALDLLEDEGLMPDTSAIDMRFGAYENFPFRTQPMDCPVGSTNVACPGLGTGARGGYTYGDFGKIGGSPDGHARQRDLERHALGPAPRPDRDARPQQRHRARARARDGLDAAGLRHARPTSSTSATRS